MTKMTLLGHQSALFESKKGTKILVDPILSSSFGSSQDLRFYIFPHRKIKSIHKVHAVLITNYHLDHFHLDSLCQLDRNTQIIVNTINPKEVFISLQNAGFKNVTKVKYRSEIEVDDFRIRFFQPGRVPVWERSVLQCTLSNQNQTFIIQSDAEIGQEIKNYIKDRSENMTLFCTNNLQIRKRIHGFNPWTNILTPPKSSSQLAPFYNILFKQLKDIPLSHIVLNGSGYTTIPNEQMFDFTDSTFQNKLNDYAIQNNFVLDNTPGTTWTFEDNTTPKMSKSPFVQLIQNMSSTNETAVTDFSEVEMLLKVHQEIRNYNKTILISPFGQTLVHINEHMRQPVASQRFVIRILHEGSAYHWVFDLNKNEFSLKNIEPNNVIRNYPFGFEIQMVDFLKVIKGEWLIWEATNKSYKQWYASYDPLKSPLSFLFSYYGGVAKNTLTL